MLNANIQLALDHCFGPQMFQLEKNLSFDELEASLAKARNPEGGVEYLGFKQFLVEAREQHQRALHRESGP
jgi:hypothetical protein